MRAKNSLIVSKTKKAVTDLAVFKPSLFDKIDEKKIANYIAIVKQMEANNNDDKRICKILGFNQSQLDLLRNRSEYESTTILNVDDPAEAIRQSLQNTAIKATVELDKLVSCGDMDAIKLVMKSVGADKPAETQMADTTKFFLDLLAKVGIKSHDRKASDQIEQLKSKKKELKSAEQLEDEKIMDVEYEILGDDDVDEELKSEVPVKKQSDLEDDSENSEE